MPIDCVVRAMLDRNSGAVVGQNGDPDSAQSGREGQVGELPGGNISKLRAEE